VLDVPVGLSEGSSRGEATAEPNSPSLHCQENSSFKFYGCPYRNPTQVGEENILRRSREPPLRNSAN
jgi:hypothetical protein